MGPGSPRTPACRHIPWRHRDHPRRARDRGGTEATAPAAPVEVSFDTSPDAYKHWTLSVDGEVATLTLDVAEDGGIVPGYELKMNSYDLGVDIELHDAVQRIRFEHPEVEGRRRHQRQGPDVLRRARTSRCSPRRRTAGR